MLSVEKLVEIFGLEDKSITARAQVQQSSQIEVTPGGNIDGPPVVINPKAKQLKNLAQNVKKGYFLTAVSVLIVGQNSN